MLPVGESPGWSGRAWWNLEVNHANIWNDNFTMSDKRNGDLYTYEADFEQSSAILDMGFQLTPRLAFAVEVPYAYRNGGILDDFIDQFHVAIGASRFRRHFNGYFDNRFMVQTNNEDNLATLRGEGLGSVKAKLKAWLWQWRSPTPGVCDCGLAISGQGKFPVQKRTNALSSGTSDFTGAVHLGFPLGQYSGMWATAAFTKLGPNDTFAGWPRHDWQEMYELSFDFGLDKNFGIILQARAESPLFDNNHLEYQYTTFNDDSQLAERIASGWNSLVYWRGSESLGLRWRWGQGSQINFLIVEDWGLGNKDRRYDMLYVNNAPDVAFVSQLKFVF